MNLSDKKLRSFKSADALFKYIDDNEDERGGSLTLASIGVGISKVIAFFKWANMMFDAQQKYEGERHTFLLVNGIPRIANYAGRGTHILQRLKDKDKPISVVDLIAQIHDIQYIESQLAKTKAEQMKIVRKADDEMLKMLQIAKEFKLDNRINIALCHFIIKQKTRLEDKNILFLSDKLRSIAGDLITLPKADIKLLQESKKNAVDEFYSLVKKQKKRFSKKDMKGGSLESMKTRETFRPPICRIGSKIPIRDDILKIMPDHKTYVEAFVGSGAIYWGKKPSEKEVLNDLDKKLMTSYNRLKNIKSRNFRTDLDSVEKLQAFVNKNHTSDIDNLTKDIIMACNTFGNAGKGDIYKPSNPYNKLKNIDKYQERMKNTTLLNQDYRSVIKKYDGSDTLFFLDPPYEKSKGFGYAEEEGFNFEELSNTLKNIKGKFILTLNDSPRIRQLFSSFNITPINVKGRGQSGIGLGVRKELIITNFNKNTMKGGALDDSKKGTIECTCGCPESKLKQRIHPTYHFRGFTPTY